MSTSDREVVENFFKNLGIDEKELHKPYAESDGRISDEYAKWLAEGIRELEEHYKNKDGI